MTITVEVDEDELAEVQAALGTPDGPSTVSLALRTVLLEKNRLAAIMREQDRSEQYAALSNRDEFWW